jgi:hypothetical protein
MNDQCSERPNFQPKSFPGAILARAQSRLIPYGIPLRFFVAASMFQIVAWGLVTYGHADVSAFFGGYGVVLAALHALTLGVLAMTAIGASYQLLSVATSVVLKSLFICRLSSWLYIPGTGLLVYAMFVGNTHAMLLGGVLVVAGLALFGVTVGNVFWHAKSLHATVRHGWVALSSMALLVVAGVSLIVDYNMGFLGAGLLPEHAKLALSHGLLGGYGFMGILVMGFSYVLVPMFALSPTPNQKLAGMSLGVNLAGLALAIGGVLSGYTTAMIVGVVLGLVGAGIYLHLMFKALRTGMKRRLGLSFVMVRASWGLLIASIIIGGLAVFVPIDFNLFPLFVFILIFGWLLTFLTGILQRILPFLTIMHAHKLGRRAPRLSEMGYQNITLKMHALCHAVALALVSLGIISGLEVLVLVGGGLGVLGAVAFLWFALGVSKTVMSLYSEEEQSK